MKLDSLLPQKTLEFPRMRAHLNLADDGLGTANAEVTHAAEAVLPMFLRFPPAESAEVSAQLIQLNRAAVERGWKEAVAEIYGSASGMTRYVTETGRAAFIDLLRITPETELLEIGPGLGQFTEEFARRARSVCAIEVVEGQAHFVAERCRQQGLTNVSLAVGGDDCRLPYPDQSFDLVVMNLVFEWCASRCVDEPHAAAQARMLDEMSRVLKPGGVLYLTTKNRFAMRLLLGKRDEHCLNLRFGSALPRWLCQRMLRSKGHARSAGWLYSHDRLAAMLRTAGFSKMDSFWATPEMRYPKHYVPTDAASIRKARSAPEFVQGEIRSTRLLMRLLPASLVKHFTPGLAFLARKPLERD